MDLEAIVRAIWRRRGRVAVCALVFAIVVPLGYSLIFGAEYASASDVTVYPPTDVDGAVRGPYDLNPDRFVATQIAVLSSHASATEVASQLQLDTDDVAKMLEIAQIEKSDAIRITATSTDAKRAAAVASRLAHNYVRSIAAQTHQEYDAAIKTVTDQLKANADQITTVTSQITAAGQTTGQAGLLQSNLSDLYAKQSNLVQQQQSYQVNRQTAAANTRVVSNATVSVISTNTSKKTLAVLGGAFGFGVAVLVISLGTAPGRTLEELDAVDEIEGVEVIGVLEPKRQRVKDAGLLNVHGLRIGSELRTIIKQKGQITLVPLGRRDRMTSATDVLVRLIAGRRIASLEEDEFGVLRTDSFASFLELPEPENQRVVLAVDVEKVSRRDLVDTLVTLDSLGTEVMGLVGIR